MDDQHGYDISKKIKILPNRILGVGGYLIGGSEIEDDVACRSEWRRRVFVTWSSCDSSILFKTKSESEYFK